MRADHDAIMLVRADLSERLATIQALSKRLSARDFADNVGGLRRLAAAYGLVPVVRLPPAPARAPPRRRFRAGAGGAARRSARARRRRRRFLPDRPLSLAPPRRDRLRATRRG